MKKIVYSIAAIAAAVQKKACMTLAVHLKRQRYWSQVKV